MSKQTETNFFMFPPRAIKSAEFYQELLKGIVDYERLGNRLISLSEQAHAFRQYEDLKELALILSNLPLEHYRVIGQYYLALGICRNGVGSIEVARNMLESLACFGPPNYRAKSLLLLSAISQVEKNNENAFRLYEEAIRVEKLNPATILAVKGIAVLKAREGYHKHALKDLERFYPIARYAPPHIYFDYLNSIAVELGEVGRKYEARNIIQTVVVSPLAIAYPEWQETAQELKEPNRSFISIPGSLPQIERKHVEIETKPAPKSKKDNRPADVLPFNKLKEAPEPDKPGRVSHIDLDDMTDSEKLDFIMTALRTGAIRPSHYNDIIYQAGMLKAGPASKVIDLEDETVLTDKLIEWAHMIDPDDLASVISALRDCDDKLRQVNLMDAMIRKLFEYSAACGVSEEAWRKKVERRLPKQ